ncbi:entericidin A/B family lipoprotein [Geminicoccus sp.]
MLSAVAALTACNTVGGAGKDISAGGEAISDTAKKASDAL